MFHMHGYNLKKSIDEKVSNHAA